MREAASRGFWISSRVPYVYNRVMVQDGAKKRPMLELDPPADGVVCRIFQMALLGTSTLDITKTLNQEGIASPQGSRWTKTTIHRILTNETYTGTLVWGTRAKDNVPPVRVEDAFPAIVSRHEFERVAAILGSKAPSKVHPPPRRQPLPAQRHRQVRDLRQGPHRPRGQERPVHLLRLPLPAEARPGSLRHPQAQRQAVRGNDRRADTGEHPHREQHPGTGEAGQRGTGQRDQGAAGKAGDGGGGVGRGEAQDGPALARGGEHRPGDQRHPAPAPRAQGASGEAGCVCGRGQGHAHGAAGGLGRRADYHRLCPGPERVPEDQRVDRAPGLHRELREGDSRQPRQCRGALHHPHARG